MLKCEKAFGQTAETADVARKDLKEELEFARSFDNMILENDEVSSVSSSTKDYMAAT